MGWGWGENMVTFKLVLDGDRERKRGNRREHFRDRKHQSHETGWSVQGRVRMARAAGE